MKPKIFLSFTLFAYINLVKVEGHSFVQCVDFKDGKCNGRARNFVDMDRYIYDPVKDKVACREKRTPNVNDMYNAQNPMASVAPGSEVTLTWPARNHAKHDPKKDGVSIFMGSKPNLSTDPTQEEFNQNKVVSLEFGANCAPGTENDRVCSGSFKVPTTPGIYTFQWFWAFHIGREYWASCFEINVGGVSSNSDSVKNIDGNKEQGKDIQTDASKSPTEGAKNAGSDESKKDINKTEETKVPEKNVQADVSKSPIEGTKNTGSDESKKNIDKTEETKAPEKNVQADVSKSPTEDTKNTGSDESKKNIDKIEEAKAPEKNVQADVSKSPIEGNDPNYPPTEGNKPNPPLSTEGNKPVSSPTNGTDGAKSKHSGFVYRRKPRGNKSRRYKLRKNKSNKFKY